MTTVPERSTANRPVQATAFAALVKFGPFRLGRQRPPVRLQRLGWTDPNLHRILERGSLESAYGSLANELLIGWDSGHLQVFATTGTKMPGSGAPARERARVVRETAADAARRAPSSVGLAYAAATDRKPMQWACGQSLPARLVSCRSRRRPGVEVIGSGPVRRSRGNIFRPTRWSPGRRAPGRGPPRRPRLDKLAFSWKAPRRGRPRVAAVVGVTTPGSASPTNRGTQSLSNSCSGSESTSRNPSVIGL